MYKFWIFFISNGHLSDAKWKLSITRHLGRPQCCVESPNRGRESLKASAASEQAAVKRPAVWRAPTAVEDRRQSRDKLAVEELQQFLEFVSTQGGEICSSRQKVGSSILWWIKILGNIFGWPCYKILVPPYQVETWSIKSWKYAKLVCWHFHSDGQGWRHDFSKVEQDHKRWIKLNLFKRILQNLVQNIFSKIFS